MAKYTTTQQYSPLVAPKTWGAEEKKFLVQLTDILDDIYRRYGRLRFEDLGNTLRTRISATESILLEVGAERVFLAATEVALLADLAAMTPPVPLAVNLLWYDSTNDLLKRCTSVGPPAVWKVLQADELNNSSITIDTNGITLLTGGNLVATALGVLKLLGGSTNATAIAIRNDTDYFISAGNLNQADAPFWLKKDGSIKALSGIFGGTFAGTTTITNPSDTDQQIVFGQNADGDFGGWITADGGTTFTQWLSFSGLVGGAVIPGSLPNTVDAYTSLLLHFFGENDSVSFTNSSQYPQTITAAGNAKITTVYSKFGGSAGYFDGTGDYLSIPDNVLYAFGSGNFTIDCWIRVPDLNPNPIASQKYHYNSDFSFYLTMGNDQHMLFQYGYADGTNSTNVVETSVTVAVNTWTHIAVVRNGETITLYVNGTSVASSTVGAASIHDSGQPVYIGTECASGSPNSYFRGSIDELRISKGIARWTANFTPPTEAYTG